MTLTEEQLEFRRTGITATDITKIVGLSKYGGPIDVLLDKRGTPSPFVETDRVRWGNILEGPIRDDYAQRFGCHVMTGDAIGTLRHESEDWILATPDGIAGPPFWWKNKQGATHGWEGKTHTGWLSHLYGEPGTDDVPSWELVQCQWNLIVARSKPWGRNMTRWDLTAFMDGVPQDYVIHHDQELADTLIEAGRVFWFDHVIGGKELEPDGSDSFSEHLGRKFPKNTEEMLEATDELLEYANGLRLVRAHIKEQEATEAKFVQLLKAAIGENSGLQWKEAAEDKDGKLKEYVRKLTWRRSKDTTKTDWKALCNDLQNLILNYGEDPEAQAALVDKYHARNTHPKPGSRRFVVPRSWSK
jgi:predicted phage-related endonuclease